MSIEIVPLPSPLLDPRDGEQLAAEAIARVNELCPELTNNNPSSPHTALAEEQALHVEEVLHAINRLPDAVVVEFARAFGIELRLASAATTTLLFTVAPPAGTTVTIPAGTQVSAGSGAYVFATAEALVIEAGETEGAVAAARTVTGRTQLAAGTLTKLVDPVAWVTTVTNEAPVDSGSEQETVAAALERARNYQQRAERIVSARDLETAILDEVMLGNGLMRVFEKTEDGYWDSTHLGHRLGNTTVVLMTRAGLPVSTEVRQQINALAAQMVGHLNLFIKDPVYHDFDVAVNVRLAALSQQDAARTRIEESLRVFYGIKTANFGRPILRSEIIQMIEGAPEVDAIVPQPGRAILASPSADIELLPYELPRLINLTLNFVV